MINLLENAIKYPAPDSPIDISARAGDNMLTINIADRVPGLPPGDERSDLHVHAAAGGQTTTGEF